MGKQRPSATIVCRRCGKSFVVQGHKTETAKFCSRPCLYSSRRKRTTALLSSPPGDVRICCGCGVEFAARNGYQKVSERPFCSYACKILNAPRPVGWNRDMSHRRKAWSILPHKCNRCGYERFKNILQVHHKDNDRHNGDPSNLEILCPNCHSEEHLSEKLRDPAYLSSTRRPYKTLARVS